ncbi:MAG: C4-dicarboxylate transporter DcuC [Lachnospiraceae bacterium]|nr:C4-dicarboxylate transporter DcuC [Lachnospiraceae bacterium]
MIAIIATLLLIVIVVAGVVKKYHPVSVFFSVSFIALIVWTLATGTSAMGEETCGNLILDVFEYAYSIIKTQLSGTMLICASIFGYVGFMNKIGASQAFTAILAKPLSKIKQPYILLGLLIVLETFMKLIIPSAASLVALLFAILFPIFAALGCSALSIASAFVLGTCVTWGPADAGVALSLSLSGSDMTLSQFFFSYQVVACILEALVMAIVFVIISIRADKKSGSKGAEVTEEQLRKQQESMNVAVPKYYCIMPLFPMILILLFSGYVFPVTISVVAAVLISISVADVIHLIANRDNLKATMFDLNAGLAELGKFLGSMGFLVVGGALFAGVIGKIGGMTLLVTALNNLGGGAVFLSILAVIMGIVVVACTGSYTANLNIFVPFLVSIGTVTGVDVAAMAQLGNMACGLGSGLTPVSATMLFVSGECKVDFPLVLKRNIVPIACAAATGYIVTMVMHVL